MKGIVPMSADDERSSPSLRSHDADDQRVKFRDAMARLGAAVNIVTTDGPGGIAGFTATAVCSVSDDPPTLLVCLKKASSAHPAITANGRLCVNVLEAGHESLSRLFGGHTPVAERFAGGRWTRLETGAPVLEGALASVDCVTKAVVNAGTHDILLCDVVDIVVRNEGAALIYFDRQYRTVR